MPLVRRVVLTLGVVTFIGIAMGARYYCQYSKKVIYHAREVGMRTVDDSERRRLDQYVTALRPFAISHGYNTKVAFLADMRVPSGKFRFFVADMKKDSILFMGLVAHGSGNLAFADRPSFSNIEGSGCTALGRYRTGGAYKGRFGRAYKLFGLDSSNDKAYRRNIVLHSYSYVPEAETDPLPICNSLGCAMVSPGFMRRLEPLIDQSARPILLWVFY